MMPSSTPLPLRTRRVRLRPPTAQFLEELYELAVLNEIPWQWGGAEETPDSFQQSLTANVLVNYMMIDAVSGRAVGFLSAYGYNQHHRYCHISMMLHPEFRLRAWPLEGILLFLNYLFVKFDFRNIYMQTAGPQMAQFKSGIGQAFDMEGQLKERLLINGKYEDLFILTLSRARWLKQGVPALDRLLSKEEPQQEEAQQAEALSDAQVTPGAD